MVLRTESKKKKTLEASPKVQSSSAPGKRLALHKSNLIRRIFQSRTLCIPENLLIHARSRRRSTDSTMEKYRRVEKPKGMTTIHKIICGSSSLSLFVIMILYLLLFLFCIFFFFLSWTLQALSSYSVQRKRRSRRRILYVSPLRGKCAIISRTRQTCCRFANCSFASFIGISLHLCPAEWTVQLGHD